MKQTFYILVLISMVNSNINAQTDTLKSNKTIGVAIDLLPPVVSAMTNHFGYSAQLWYGYNKIRVRGVIAGFQMPNKLMGNSDFKDMRITATALIVDCFKDYNFKSFWLGAGFELWNSSITAKIDNRNHHWNNYVATVGGGYIYKVYKNFYIEPWGALHGVLNDEKVSVGSKTFKPKKVQGEVSLKVGWHF